MDSYDGDAPKGDFRVNSTGRNNEGGLSGNGKDASAKLVAQETY